LTANISIHNDRYYGTPLDTAQQPENRRRFQSIGVAKRFFREFEDDKVTRRKEEFLSTITVVCRLV